MASKFVTLAMPPGVLRMGTAYASKGRWYDSSLIRWVGSVVRPIGGWSLARTAAGGDIQATGKPRASHTWRKNDSTTWAATGTTGTPSKLYVYSNGVITDITPAGLTNGAADGMLITGSGRWGIDPWSVSPWGGSVAAGTIQDAATWSLDSFGEILIACLTADGKLYESTPTTQATQITNSPTGCRAVCVTAERFVFALGTAGDPRNVAWCSQSNRILWAPAASNSAGSFPLQTGGRLMAGHATPRETLLWTDADLWAAQYIGGPLVYAFQPRGDHCGLIGPNAVAITGGTAYWMSSGQFFSYDGTVRQLQCDVLDYVFSDLNRAQKAKIHALTISQHGEVWWFYPSQSQTGSENDRAVTLNYRTGEWTLHRLARSAGSDADVFNSPLMWSTDGHLYSHETGNDRGGASAYLESGPLEIGDGDRVMQVQEIIPDEAISGSVTATLYSAFEPQGQEAATGPFVLSKYILADGSVFSGDITQLTGPFTLQRRTDVRVTARQLRIRLAEPVSSGAIWDGTYTFNGAITYAGTRAGVDFRIGTFRLGVVAGGRR